MTTIPSPGVPAPRHLGNLPAAAIPSPAGGRSKRRNKSGEIGTKAEAAVVRFLAGHGFPHAERRRLRGSKDAGDITGCPGLCIEVKGGDAAKNASDLLVADWLEETEKERLNARADIGVLVLQRRGVGPANAGRWWAILPAAVWADLVYAQLDGLTEHHRYPIRLLLADAVRLMRSAGYGDPLDPEVS